LLEIINTFISSILLISNIYIYGKIINIKQKIDTKNVIVSIIVFSCLYTLVYILVNTYNIGTLKTMLICLVYSVTFYSIFETSILKSLFVSILYIFLLILAELLTLGVVTELISKEYCYNIFARSITGNLCITVVMIVILLVLKRLLKKLINYTLSTNKKIIFVSLLTLTSILIFFYNLINSFRVSNDIIGYLIVIATLMLILFYLFKQKIENESISKKYDDLLNIMKDYENDIEEQRIMIHENRNELMTIKCKINDKAKEQEIIKYIDSILGDKVSSKMSKYSKFKYLPSNGIKGFLYYKFKEAEKRNIKVSVNISKKIENSFLGKLDTKDFKDLVRMIGVYVDNAIDASAESKDKKLGIEIYLIKQDIEMIISNTFNNDIDTEKIGIEKFTTKGKNHGHGLLLVKHILRNNSNFESNREIINNLYVQKIKIKNIINQKTQ